MFVICFTQSPGSQISLYNSVIEHLARKAADQQLQELSWPITELSLEHDGTLVLHLFFQALN